MDRGGRQGIEWIIFAPLPFVFRAKNTRLPHMSIFFGRGDIAVWEFELDGARMFRSPPQRHMRMQAWGEMIKRYQATRDKKRVGGGTRRSRYVTCTCRWTWMYRGAGGGLDTRKEGSRKLDCIGKGFLVGILDIHQMFNFDVHMTDFFHC